MPRTKTKTTNTRSRPETTLLLNISVDGRITSHDSDLLDPDKSWKQTPGIRSILQQFYEFKQKDMTVLTTGSSMAALGINTRPGTPKPEPISLVVLDPDADLTPQGLTYLSQNVQKLILICLSNHPTPPDVRTGIACLEYPKEIDLNEAFTQLYQKYLINKLFIHSIASLNADLIDAGLIDHLSLIISPLLVGGHGTPALQDSDILTVRPLKLVSCQNFSDNYVNLRYDVLI